MYDPQISPLELPRGFWQGNHQLVYNISRADPRYQDDPFELAVLDLACQVDLMEELEETGNRPSSHYPNPQYHYISELGNQLTMTPSQPDEKIAYLDISYVLEDIPQAYSELLQGEVKNGEFNVWESPPNLAQPPLLRGQLGLAGAVSVDNATKVENS